MRGGSLIDADDGPTTSEAEFVRRMVADLWPSGSVETRTRPRWRRPPSGSVELVVLPSLTRPRMLIPRRSERGSAAAIRTYKTSASGLARRKLQLLAVPTRLGLARLHPHVVTVVPTGEALVGLDDHLGAILGQELVAGIHIGPSRAVRKPVLQLLTPGGECVAFAKVGINPLTRQLVAREADILVRLAGSTWSCVHLPEVLFQGTWKGLEVLALRALTPAGGQPVTPALRTAAMLEVAGSGGLTEGPLRDSAYLAELSERVEALPASTEAGLLTSSLESVRALAGDVTLRIGAWHGDWTPWNMAADGDRLLLWDWEHFEEGVPVGFDAVHHSVNSAVRTGVSVRQAYAEPQLDDGILLAPFQGDAPGRSLTAMLYVIDIASRYVRDGEIEAGTVLGDLPTWLAPVLADRLAGLARSLGR